MSNSSTNRVYGSRGNLLSRVILAAFLAATIGMAGCGGGPSGDENDAGPSDAGRANSDGSRSSFDGDTALPARNYRYLRAEPDPRLVVEIDYVDGWSPRESVSDGLEDRLASLLDKPDGVAFQHDEALESRGDDPEWTKEQLSNLANDTLDLSVSEEAAKMHVLFLNGHHEEDTSDRKTLGLAWGNKNVVIFKETIESGCSRAGLGGLTGGNDACATAERSVWKHEIGHVLGLVENPLPMQEEHRDEEHGAHCDNEDCVMHWSYDGPALFDRLASRFESGNEQSLPFGPNCTEDMEAAK